MYKKENLLYKVSIKMYYSKVDIRSESREGNKIWKKKYKKKHKKIKGAAGVEEKKEIGCPSLDWIHCWASLVVSRTRRASNGDHKNMQLLLERVR